MVELDFAEAVFIRQQFDFFELLAREVARAVDDGLRGDVFVALSGDELDKLFDVIVGVGLYAVHYADFADFVCVMGNNRIIDADRLADFFQVRQKIRVFFEEIQCALHAVVLQIIVWQITHPSGLCCAPILSPTPSDVRIRFWSLFSTCPLLYRYWLNPIKHR